MRRKIPEMKRRLIGLPAAVLLAAFPFEAEAQVPTTYQLTDSGNVKHQTLGFQCLSSLLCLAHTPIDYLGNPFGTSSNPFYMAFAAPPTVNLGNINGSANGITNPLYVAPIGSYFANVAGSVLTRPSNTTAYTANETVCAAASGTVCAPGTIAIANTGAGKGLINRVTLLKSGSSLTSATFTIWLFSAAPGVSSPSQFDATSYTGPRAADMPNYIGNAQCNTAIATSDSSPEAFYDCTLSNPNTAGALEFQALSGSTSINYLISVTGGYTPASAETFTPFVSGFY